MSEKSPQHTIDTSELDAAGLTPLESEADRTARVEGLASRFDLPETKEVNFESLSKLELQQELRKLNEEEQALGEMYRGNVIWETVPPYGDLSTLDEDTQAKVRLINDEYHASRSALQSKINSLRQKLDEININETEAEVDAYIKANPSKRNLQEVMDFSKRKEFTGEGNYSSGDEMMSDVHVVLSSELKNNEKLAIINALSDQITSSTIGDNRSNLLKRYKERLSV